MIEEKTEVPNGSPDVHALTSMSTHLTAMRTREEDLVQGTTADASPASGHPGTVPPSPAMDLLKFCGGDEFRPYLKTPFRFNGYVYATDGRIMVRVDDDVAYPSSDKVNPEKIISPALSASFINAPAVNIPPKPHADLVECEVCDGRGTEHDCPDCQCECDTCGGSGETLLRPLKSAMLAGQIFDVDYLRLVYSLPGLEIAPNPAASGGYSALPFFFRFSHGVGVVMPMTREHPIHVDITPSKD